MPPSYTKKRGLDARGNQRYVVDPSRFLFNVDTLWYTIYVENYNQVMESGFQDLLIDGRSSYLDGEGERFVPVTLRSYDNPIYFTIGGGQKIYSYSIRSNDMAFYFRKKYEEGETTYPVKVQINQEILWTKGVVQAYIESLQVLASLGFVYGHAKPNRIDVCCHSDQFQFNYDDLKWFEYPRDPKKENHPDFRRLDPETGDFGTVYYGSRDRCLLRIYNKSKEVIEKAKHYFLELYKKKGLDPTKVWNVEFEVHRDYLKGFADPNTKENCFDDMEYLLNQDGLSRLWSHLTKSFQMIDCKYWKVLQDGDPNIFKRFEDPLIRVKTIDDSKDREVIQIRGRLMKMVENQAVEAKVTLREALLTVEKKILEYEEEKNKNFADDVNKKRSKYQDYLLNTLVNKKEPLISGIKG